MKFARGFDPEIPSDASHPEFVINRMSEPGEDPDLDHGAIISVYRDEALCELIIGLLNEHYSKVRKREIRLTDKQKKRAIDDLKKLYGDPPYDGGSNIVLGDGYFANSLISMYGMSIAELADACGYTKWRVTKDKAYRKYLKEIGVHDG